MFFFALTLIKCDPYDHFFGQGDKITYFSQTTKYDLEKLPETNNSNFYIKDCRFDNIMDRNIKIIKDNGTVCNVMHAYCVFKNGGQCANLYGRLHCIQYGFTVFNCRANDDQAYHALSSIKKYDDNNPLQLNYIFQGSISSCGEKSSAEKSLAEFKFGNLSVKNINISNSIANSIQDYTKSKLMAITSDLTATMSYSILTNNTEESFLFINGNFNCDYCTFEENCPISSHVRFNHQRYVSSSICYYKYTNTNFINKVYSIYLIEVLEYSNVTDYNNVHLFLSQCFVSDLEKSNLRDNQLIRTESIMRNTIKFDIEPMDYSDRISQSISETPSSTSHPHVPQQHSQSQGVFYAIPKMKNLMQRINH